MKIPPVSARIAPALGLLLAAIGLNPQASASAFTPIYTTADLGSSYQFLAGAGGQDYGVVGSNGIAYAFDKSPVIQINIQSDSQYDDSHQVLTMQDGSYQVGYATAHGQAGISSYATF